MKTQKKIKFDKKSIYYLMHQLYDIILSSLKGIIEQSSVNVLLYESLFFRVFNSIHIHGYLCYLLHVSQKLLCKRYLEQITKLTLLVWVENSCNPLMEKWIKSFVMFLFFR